MSPDRLAPSTLDDTTSAIIGTALRIHRQFGDSLLESAYELLMYSKLADLGFAVERQLPISFEFEGIMLSNAFRVDLLVNQMVVVEIKSVDKLRSVHEQQLSTYLRLMHLPVGLLINFGQDTIKDGLRRAVNTLNPGDSPTLRMDQPPVNQSGCYR